MNDPQSSRTVTAAVDANGDLAIAGLGVLSCPSSMATCRLRMDGCEAPGDPYTGSGGALEAADGGSCVYSVTYKYAWCTGTSTGGTQFLTLLLTPT